MWKCMHQNKRKRVFDSLTHAWRNICRATLSDVLINCVLKFEAWGLILILRYLMISFNNDSQKSKYLKDCVKMKQCRSLISLFVRRKFIVNIHVRNDASLTNNDDFRVSPFRKPKPQFQLTIIINSAKRLESLAHFLKD